ncbi:MAG: alpha-2-macroglobulin [Candidatus Berkiella sp.]
MNERRQRSINSKWEEYMHHSCLSNFFISFIFLFIYASNTIAQATTEAFASPELLKQADTYYQKHIKNGISAASTHLEKIERKVRAKQSFDAQDWYGSRYALYQVLADNNTDFQTWFLLCKSLIGLQEYDTYQNYDELLQTAFIKAHQNIQTSLDKAALYWLASQTKLQFTQLRETALNLASQANIEAHISALIKNYPTEFAAYQLDIPQRTDIASACLTWTYPLLKSRNFHYEDYISITPKVKDLGVIARGKQLCVEGLNFGENYRLTLKAGFPSESGTSLLKDQSLNLYIPHRKSAIRFREKGYILASGAPQIVPLVAVNVSEVKLKIIHIPERNIQSIQTNWFANQLSRWDADNIAEEEGEIVWQGTYRFDSETDKTAISGLPIDKMMGKKLQAGVYLVEARTTEDSYDPDEFASQALVISDIGLSTYHGPDGLHVFARSLSNAKTLPDVSIRLISRNNRELHKMTTDKEGHAVFTAEILNGKGGNRPAFLTATQKDQQFTVLNLRDEAFDLSDRSAQGRNHQGTIDAYLFTERGIYRPGETIHHLCLLRDNKGQATTKLPITLKIFRPDGVIAQESLLQDRGNGSYTFDYAINHAAQTGTWTTAIYLDPTSNELAHTSFEVNDFVPPRIEVKTSSTLNSIVPQQSNNLVVNAQYYFGAPGANLKVTAESKLIPMPKPFSKWKTYHFGLIEEEWSAQRFKHLDTVTDEQGKASIITKVDLEPQTSHPLQLETTTTVFEIGGRGQSSKQTTLFWHQPYIIGIEPQFKDNSISSNSNAKFNIIALNQKGELQSTQSLRYTLYEEQHDYVWFRAGTHWQYEVVIRDNVVANGTFQLDNKAPLAFTIPVKYGPYRLEVLDEKTGIATSFRFSAGWHFSEEAPDRPDTLEVSFSEDNEINARNKANIYIKSPFEGQLFVAWAGDNFKPIHTGKIGSKGINLELSIPKALRATPGNYLIATVYRGSDDQSSQMPKRAIGVSWVPNKQFKEKHEIELSLEHPTVVNSTKTVDILVKASKAHKHLNVAVALVDEGTLSLTDYKTPKPYQYFFSQKNLNYALRDSYGHLINPYGARPGSFEVGGGESILKRALTQLPARSYKVVSLFSGIIEAKENEAIHIPFTLPEYTGKLRVMAVAWDEQGVGHAQSSLSVQDPIDAYLVLPRFLAPHDNAKIPLVLKNVEAPEGDYSLTLQSAKDKVTQKIHLQKGQELRIPFILKAETTGIKKIELFLTDSKDFAYKRQWELSVRPTIQPISLQAYGKIEAKSSLTLDEKLLHNFQENSSNLSLSIGSLPELGSAQLIQDLLQYPYYCLEQTTSRLFATLLSSNPSNEAIQKGFNQLTTLQKIDGSFSLWSHNGQTEPWLSLYTADLLHSMKQAGHAVPLALIQSVDHWLKEMEQRSINPSTEHQSANISIAAYAHYILAKENQSSLRSLRFFADSHQKDIIRRRDLAFIGAAFAHYGDAQNATLWFDKAINTIDTQNDSDFLSFGSELRDNAILVTLIAETTQNNEKLYPLLQSLVDKARLSYFLSTQEKAWLIRADFALKDARKKYYLSLNNKTLDGVQPQILNFDYKALKQAPILQNTGDTPVYYALSQQGEPIDVKALPQSGFALQRSVYTLEGQYADLEKMKSGDLYIVKIKGQRSNNTLHHVLLVDLLPPGFEIEQTTLSDLAEQFPWLGSMSQASRIESRDDRFMAAFELARQNDFTVAYMVRAVSAGTFNYPPTFVEAMYQPQFFAYGEAEKIHIYSK